MSDQAGILPKWFSSQGIILAKGQLNHSYTFWTMPILMFSPVQIIITHPLLTDYIEYHSIISNIKMCWGISSIFLLEQERLTNIMIIFYSHPPLLYPVLPSPPLLSFPLSRIMSSIYGWTTPLSQNRLVQKDPAAVNNNASHSFKCALQKGWYKVIWIVSR